MPGTNARQAPPEETVTVVFTVAEWSTPPWEMSPDAAAAAVSRQDELVEPTMRAHGAVWSVRAGQGNGVVAAFRSPGGALGAAWALQRALASERWPGGLVIRARIGLYTGEVRGRDGRDRTGLVAHRAARLCDAAHAGQILVSEAAASLPGGAFPEGTRLADLGIHQLRDLPGPEHVFELRHGDAAHGFPPLRAVGRLPANLPSQLTSFVGRGDEIAQVRRLAAEQRLVTLTGPGGCGKTRLAVQVAAEVADRWPDGVWWVDLGSVTDPTMVAELAASTMRVLVEPAGGPLRALATQLAQARLLLCLDTCEHLLDAIAELAGTLLHACPGVSVLATSREPLGVAGETVWRVPSLREGEAVHLFADRAALARPGLTMEDDPAVRAVCRRLDGIPLAIELAAAWVRVLAPAEIAAGMDDRFRLLAGGPRGVVARHRTLAASMEWSHDLLEKPDRVVFRRLAVFAGGFTLQAAHDVCDSDDVLAAVGRLVDKSLVVVQEDGREVRYRLLDTVRQYAEGRLHEAGETATIRDRHLDHFLAFAELAGPELERDQDRWRMVLEAERDNLHAALEWGLAATGPERGRRLAASLARWWFLHGHAATGHCASSPRDQMVTATASSAALWARASRPNPAPTSTLVAAITGCGRQRPVSRVAGSCRVTTRPELKASSSP
jgi:predicted ATPase/class 3 adenylate cyclase